MKPRIVASLGRDPVSDLKGAEGADLIEIRMDLLDKNPLRVLKEVQRSASCPIIATNRMPAEGGGFDGSESDRIELLLQASDHADYVDIELQAPGRDDLLSGINSSVIVSFHDFSGMPDRNYLKFILKEMGKTGADIAKIAVTPRRLKDNLEILDFLLQADIPLCMIAMGELGRHIRAVAPLYGSALTYGYVSEPTAPGQMSVSELRQALNLLERRGLK